MNSFIEYIKKNIGQLSLVFAVFISAVLVFHVNVFDFQASVLGGIKSAPFDGTVAPIKKVPDWVSLDSSLWKANLVDIPLNKLIDLPEYVPNQLTIPVSTLNFKNNADRLIRDAQVTYSTPYMGNYKLDGKEYVGSHLAIDIKIPTGTPIYSIANGVVVKVGNQSSGFGNHVVIRHDDVPSINDPYVKATYYSSYSHLNAYNVTVGQQVTKGQQIGESGNSGTATTPHIHFQIDNDQAPWHPYWPYTSKEASDAGYDFWSAVNAGLGKDKALATTIHPMQYVQKYLNYGASTSASSSSSSNTTTPTTPASNESTTTTNTTPDELPPTSTSSSTVVPADPISVISQPPVDVTPAAVPLASLDMTYSKAFQKGVPLKVKVFARDDKGEVIADVKTGSETSIRIENGSAALSTTYLTDSDFVNGVAEFTITPNAEFGIKFSLQNGSVVAESDVLQAAAFLDVTDTSDGYVAINFLKNNEIIRGYSDGTFKPENPVSRVEALKFIYEGLNITVPVRVVLEFSDTDSKAWYARYVAAAQQHGIVQGYQGNVFKPANSVTKAEFLKMLLESAGYNAKSYVPATKPFSDVAVNAWYAGYVQVAKDKNLLDTSTNVFQPDKAMTREEVAQILYKVILLEATGKIKYDATMVVNADDISNFYNRV